MAIIEETLDVAGRALEGIEPRQVSAILDELERTVWNQRLHRARGIGAWQRASSSRVANR